MIRKKDIGRFVSWITFNLAAVIVPVVSMAYGWEEVYLIQCSLSLGITLEFLVAKSVIAELKEKHRSLVTSRDCPPTNREGQSDTGDAC